MDQDGREGEFLFQGVIGCPELRVLHPRLGRRFYRNELPGHVTSFASFRASSISLRGVFSAFLANTLTTTKRRPVAVPSAARSIPSFPLMRISQSGPSRCFTSCSRPFS